MFGIQTLGYYGFKLILTISRKSGKTQKVFILYLKIKVILEWWYLNAETKFLS